MRSITQRFFAEPRPVGGVAFGDPRRDVAFAERVAMLAAVIRPVGEQRLRPELAVNAGWRDPINERDELGYVVAIAGGEGRGQRSTLTVARSHGAWSPACGDRRARGLSFRPPFCSHVRTVNDSARPVQLPGVLQFVQEHLVQALPDPRFVPVP